MTLLLLNTRIGQFALAAAAVAMILVAFGAPAVTEAAGGAQTAAVGAEGASEDFIFTLLAVLLGGIFVVGVTAGAIGGSINP